MFGLRLGRAEGGCIQLLDPTLPKASFFLLKRKLPRENTDRGITFGEKLMEEGGLFMFM